MLERCKRRKAIVYFILLKIHLKYEKTVSTIEFIFTVGILDINIYIVEVMFKKLLFHEKTLTFYNIYITTQVILTIVELSPKTILENIAKCLNVKLKW